MLSMVFIIFIVFFSNIIGKGCDQVNKKVSEAEMDNCSINVH